MNKNEVLIADYPECVPEGKRRYGYFVLPVLWNDRLVGRLDPKSDRAKKQLIISNLRFEDDFFPEENFLKALAEQITALAKFNDCQKIVLRNGPAVKIRQKLQSLLKNDEIV